MRPNQDLPVENIAVAVPKLMDLFNKIKELYQSNGQGTPQNLAPPNITNTNENFFTYLDTILKLINEVEVEEETKEKIRKDKITLYEELIEVCRQLNNTKEANEKMAKVYLALGDYRVDKLKDHEKAIIDYENAQKLLSPISKTEADSTAKKIKNTQIDLIKILNDDKKDNSIQKHDKIIAMYQQIYGSDPSYGNELAIAHHNRGNVFMQSRHHDTRHHDEAISDYEEAEKIQKAQRIDSMLQNTMNLKKARLELIKSLKDKNNKKIEDHNKIIALYKQINKTDSTHGQELGVAYFNLGELLQNQTKYQEARDNYGVAQGYYPGLASDIEKKNKAIDIAIERQNKKNKAIDIAIERQNKKNKADIEKRKKDAEVIKKQTEEHVELLKNISPIYHLDHEPPTSPQIKVTRQQKKKITNDDKEKIVELVSYIVREDNNAFWIGKTVKGPIFWEKNEKEENKLPDSFTAIRAVVDQEDKDVYAKFDALKNAVKLIKSNFFTKVLRDNDTQALYNAIANDNITLLEQILEKAKSSTEKNKGNDNKSEKTEKNNNNKDGKVPRARVPRRSGGKDIDSL